MLTEIFPIQAQEGKTQKGLLPAAYAWTKDYPLAPNVIFRPDQVAVINPENFESITEDLLNFYKGTAIGRTIFEDVAKAMDPSVTNGGCAELPPVYRFIQSGMCLLGRRYQVTAGTPEYRYRWQENTTITLQDLSVVLDQYQDPRQIKAIGNRYNTAVSAPWVISRNYGGKFIERVGTLTKSFASALAIAQEPIRLEFSARYSPNPIDSVSLPALIEKGRLDELNIYPRRDIEFLTIGGVSFRPPDGYSNPPEALSRFDLLKAIYDVALKKFIGQVKVVQTDALNAAQDFVSQMEPRNGSNLLIPMATRMIYDTWPAALLIFWRQKMSQPISTMLQKADGS